MVPGAAGLSGRRSAARVDGTVGEPKAYSDIPATPGMDVRSLLGSLQLPVAVVGAVLVAGGVSQMAALTPVPERGGLPGGLALCFSYAIAWAGSS